MAAKATKVQFEVLHRSGRARVGKLLFENESIPTPCCLLHTEGGALQHLQPDLIAQLENGPIQTTVSQIFPDPFKALQSATDLSYRRFAQLPARSPWLLTTTEATYLTPDGFNTDTGTSIWNQSGRVQITPDVLLRVLERCQPDLALALCDSQSAHASEKRQLRAVERTKGWVDTIMAGGVPAATAMLLPIIGGSSQRARTACTEHMVALAPQVAGFYIDSPFAGQSPDAASEILHACCDALPDDKLRVINATATFDQLLAAIEAGVDLLDGQLAVQAAEDGIALHCGPDGPPGTLSLWAAHNKDDMAPLVAGCECYACRNFGRAYIHHLHVTHEMLASILLTLHNHFQLQTLMAHARDAIRRGDLSAWIAKLRGSNQH